MPANRRRLPAEIEKERKKRTETSVSGLLFGPPGPFQVFCLHFEQNSFYTFRGNRNVPLPEACLLGAVLSLLFTLLGGGNLAQGSKITALGEADSWKFFAGAGLQSSPTSRFVALNVL